MSEALRLAAFRFSVDRVTAEAGRALAAASLPFILLKGPAIASWLYSPERPRFYVDTDLLVRGGDWDAAATVLGSLGFEDDLGPLAHPRMESGAGHPWVRPADGAAVDLHRTLFGVGAEPEALWAAFSAGAGRMRVGGVDVAVPGPPARLLHIALHAVQHGGESQPQPMMDLELAVGAAPAQTWGEARARAARLDAGGTFAAGLRLLPAGRELAEAIGAEREDSATALLRVDGVPLAEGFREISEAAGLRMKLGLAIRELFPTPAFMRWWTPLAGRGRPGLAAAYAWRALWLAYRAIPGYLAWRRARSSGAGGAADHGDADRGQLRRRGVRP